MISRFNLKQAALAGLILFLVPRLAFAAINVPTNFMAMNSGLVGWWTMDGDQTDWTTGITKDSSGSGNNGQLIGMSTTTSPSFGKIGQALKFDGVDDYVDVGAKANLNFGANDSWTFSTWVYVNSADYPNYFSDKFAGPYGQGGAFLSIENYLHRFCYREWGGSWSMYCSSDESAADVFDKWTHLTFVATGNSSIAVYKNGVYKETITTGAQGTIFSPYRLGQGYDGSFYKGSMDDIRIYNRALSASEVSKLYNATAGSKVSVSQPGPGNLNSGLVGWWTLDGDQTDWTTNITKDSSGSGNNGQLVNMSTTTSPVLGKIGQAFRFNGGYINVSGLTWTPTAFTVSWWLYPTSCTNYNQNISAAIGWNSFTFHTTSACEIYVGTDISTRFTPTDLPSGTVALNKWQYFTYTYDGTQGRFYKNSALIAGPKNQTSSWGWGGFWIGQASAMDSIYGNIDDVRVYNRALSAGEVARLYQMGK